MRVSIVMCWLRAILGDHKGHSSRRRRRELERSVRQLLRGLDISTPLDAQQLCHAVGSAVRGHPIDLVAKPLSPSTMAGAWMSVGGVDTIFVEQDTSPLHQLHIVLHELGHIIAGHAGEGQHSGSDPRALLAMVAPDLDEALIDRFLRRGGRYDQHEEFEAETIATTILSWAELVQQQPIQMSTPDPSTTLERLTQAFYERRGW